MILYAITIFLSAFLLFQVQPLIAKIILPQNLVHCGIITRFPLLQFTVKFGIYFFI